MSNLPSAQLSDSVRIPTLPASVERIRALLASPDVSLADVVDAFREDPPLAAKVLKIANSVHYGLRVKTTSLAQAISVVGLRTLSMIVLRAGILSLYEDTAEADQACLRDLWRHSVFTAQVCEDLARRCRRRGRDLAPQDYYSCGLLHDIGKIVLFDSLGDAYLDVARAMVPGDPHLEAEELRLLGIGHPDAGYMAAVLWKIPEPIPSVIRCHHRPNVQAELADVVKVVACADEIASAIERNPSATAKEIQALLRTIPGGLAEEALRDAIEAALQGWLELQP